MGTYKVETLETNLGDGVRISDGRQSYEQYRQSGNLVARLATEDGKTTGVIYPARFRENSESYGLFRTLAKRLEVLAKETIPSEKPDFIHHMAHGYTYEMSDSEIDFRINPRNRRPEAVKDYVNEKANSCWSFISDVLVIGYLAVRIERPVPALIFTAMTLAVDAAFAFAFGLKFTPTHMPGYWPARWITEEQIAKPEHLTQQFRKKHSALAAVSGQIRPGNSADAKNLEEELDELFPTIGALFTSTHLQKGLAVHITGRSREETLLLMEYLITGNSPRVDTLKS
ncbi:hypothetical protein HYU12_02940 [Candidatus Woesearchaeota archaeon]|nr:hypothetical protein [Candidatus Woesearchaeota archaeon]